MSGWMIYGQDLPPEAQTIDDIPSDFVPKPIGARAEVIAAVREIAPASQFGRGCDEGTIPMPGCWIEFSIGKKDPSMGITFEVRAITEEGVTLIAKILDRLHLRALQTGESGDLFDPSTAMASYCSWRNYRTQIIATEQ